MRQTAHISRCGVWVREMDIDSAVYQNKQMAGNGLMRAELERHVLPEANRCRVCLCCVWFVR